MDDEQSVGSLRARKWVDGAVTLYLGEAQISLARQDAQTLRGWLNGWLAPEEGE